MHIDFDIFGYFVDNSSLSCVFFVNIGGYLFCTFHIILMDIIFVNCDFLAVNRAKCVTSYNHTENWFDICP